MSYIVEINPGCWLSPWMNAKSAHTYQFGTANRYETETQALKALADARITTRFPNAKIVEVTR